jgi:hypothetical protein
MTAADEKKHAARAARSERRERAEAAPAAKITPDDIRARMDRVQQLAERDAESLMRAQQMRIVLIAAVSVAAVAGLAYAMGRSAGRSGCPRLPSAAEIAQR